MLIDCDACSARGPACGECVVSVMLGAPPEGVEVDETERRALEVLAGSGLVPRLRLHVVGRDTVDVRTADGRAVDGRGEDGRTAEARGADGRRADGRGPARHARAAG